ncbi:MAG: hypothetical protein IPF99_29020 [Deltaproteobacteria bacterium]|nr:hypothetical protein [Deltaproteobacteria bacterium]
MKLFLHAITTISEREHDVLLVSSSRDAAGLATDIALRDRSWMAIDRGGAHREKKPEVEPQAIPADSARSEPGINWTLWIGVGILALTALGLFIATRPPPGERPPPPSGDSRPR